MKKPAKEAPRSQASLFTEVLLPLAAVIRGDLLALVHQLGMQAIAAMLEAERTKLCGERYKHDASRSATRAGSTRGELALGGRRVSVRRPRVTDREGHEVPLEAWTKLSGTDPLDARALEQMAIGVATRKYARSLETLPDEIASRGTSKSAVSRRFVALTADKLKDWMARSLAELDICASAQCILTASTSATMWFCARWESTRAARSTFSGSGRARRRTKSHARPCSKTSRPGA